MNVIALTRPELLHEFRTGNRECIVCERRVVQGSAGLGRFGVGRTGDRSIRRPDADLSVGCRCSETLSVVSACCRPPGATCWRIRFRCCWMATRRRRATRIWESSRFCVDTKNVAATAENGLREATFLLFAAMIEWGQQRDLQAIATVTDLRMERILRRAGWHLDRLGDTSSNRSHQSRGWTVADHR